MKRFTRTRTRTRTLALTAAVLSGALVLAACGSDDKDKSSAKASTSVSAPAAASAPASASASAPASAGAFNDADVMFAQMMIPHHEQAVEMAKEAPAKGADTEVKKLAATIEAAQAPEIKLMKGWLTTWGKPTSAPGGMNHGGGMMSEADMTAFKASTGADFDRRFLTMMIEHHNGAIAMAETELAQGVDPAARKLAEQIKSSQAAEVQQMRQMLTAMGGSTPSTPSMPGMNH
ncbi:DUF305 domain-containing protein [Embleya sp. NPDC020630]|uniref:DUF305 domain-containing protein n=1 Tax=Embleya sp. NPDC020630 TaxID=3363979 RepID=UPI0037AE76C8